MKKCECGEGIPEDAKVYHSPEVGYLGPCCASEDAESVLLAGEDTDEDDTDEDDDSDDDSDDDWDDEDTDEDEEEEPGTPPGTIRVWIDGESFDEAEVRRWGSQREAAPGTLGCHAAARILREHLEEVYEPGDKTYWAKGDVQIYLDGRWQDDREVRVSIHPEEPKCPREAWGLSDDDDSAHRWRAPHSIVGGCESNPGVQGNGGGVVCEEVCTLCGCARITDTWAQDPDGGEQGLTSIEYEADKYEDEIMRTLEVTLRPDDADEDEDEDEDDEDEDEDGYEEAKYELDSWLRRYFDLDGRQQWEQDPSEPDVVRVRVPMGLRKTLQDKLVALDCVEDCAEA